MSVRETPLRMIGELSSAPSLGSEFGCGRSKRALKTGLFVSNMSLSKTFRPCWTIKIPGICNLGLAYQEDAIAVWVVPHGVSTCIRHQLLFLLSSLSERRS